MADENLKSWLRQAHADLEAGGIQASQECHRRYWLQQACEKGIKALGLLLWERSSPDAAPETLSPVIPFVNLSLRS